MARSCLGAAAPSPLVVSSALALLAAALLAALALHPPSGDNLLSRANFAEAPDATLQPAPAAPANDPDATPAPAPPAPARRRNWKRARAGYRRARRRRVPLARSQGGLRPTPLAQSEGRLASTCPDLAAAWVPPRRGMPQVYEQISGPNQEPKLGDVEARGAGLEHATVGERTCFELLARGQDGNPFDQGPLQRAYFQVLLALTRVPHGTPAVRLAADVQYLPESSTHRACYTPIVPGEYGLIVYLVFDNAWRIAAYLSTANGAGYRRHKIVRRAKVNVHSAAAAQQGGVEAGTRSVEGAQEAVGLSSKMPPCTFEMLRRSQNEGSWLGQQWLPRACNSAFLEPEDILKFLHGKRIAMIGDSEMRYAFNILRRWLRFLSTDAFTGAAKGLPLYRNLISLPPSQHRNVLPFNLRTCRASAYHTAVENGDLTFYGTFWTGFGQYLVRRRSSVNKNATYAFNITYVVHLSAEDPLGQRWMANRSFTNGATVPDEQGPYDLAFVAVGLHDLRRFHNETGFAAALRERFLPALRRLVEKPDSAVFFGSWAANEVRKPAKYVHCSNNIRGRQFEITQRDVLQEQGFSNFISTRLMTMARPDLCIDSTHYSWPVALAMLNLAFTAMGAMYDV